MTDYNFSYFTRHKEDAEEMLANSTENMSNTMKIALHIIIEMVDNVMKIKQATDNEIKGLQKTVCACDNAIARLATELAEHIKGDCSKCPACENCYVKSKIEKTTNDCIDNILLYAKDTKGE